MAGQILFTPDWITTTGQIVDFWASAGSMTYLSSVGRNGGAALVSVNGNSAAQSKTINYSISNTVPMNFGFNYKAANVTSLAPSEAILSLNTDQGTFYVLQSGSNGYNLQILTQLGGSSTPKIQGTHTLIDGNYHWIEISILLSTTGSGYIKLYVDGVLDVNYSGATTTDTLATTLYYYNLNGPGANSGTITSYFSDFHFWDGSGSTFNTFPIGPSYVTALQATSNGSTNQYTPSTGSNYSCINGGLAASTYVSDATTGHVDLYNFASLSYTPSKVNGVSAVYFGQNSGTGTANLIAQLKTGSTLTTGSTQTLTVSSNSILQQIWNADATGTAWTYSTVNGSQYGQGD
jgi:hypothetical protein